MTFKEIPEISFQDLVKVKSDNTPLKSIALKEMSDFEQCYEAVTRSFEKNNHSKFYTVFRRNMQLIAIQL